MKFLLWPGDIIAGMAGMEPGSENRQVLRMYANTVIYSIVGILIMLPFVM